MLNQDFNLCIFLSTSSILSSGITIDIMLKNEGVTVVRKLGSKLLIARQKCVKVRPDQTDATAKL